MSGWEAETQEGVHLRVGMGVAAKEWTVEWWSG